MNSYYPAFCNIIIIIYLIYKHLYYFQFADISDNCLLSIYLINFNVVSLKHPYTNMKIKRIMKSKIIKY